MHIETNRAHWDEVADFHRESYDTKSLVTNPSALSTVAEEDAELLLPFLPNNSAAGLDMIHLQCHIGADTLSWARMGAHMTGVDMSARSLDIARELAAEASQDIEYIQSTIADAENLLAGRVFDVVYTSIGVLGWLDDLEQWARLVSSLLRPGGTFFIREGHPMAMALDIEAPEGVLRLDWPYFNVGPLVDESDADYSSPNQVTNARTYEWAHPLSEVFSSLMRAGLTIVDFQEQDTLPWKFLPWMVPTNAGRQQDPNCAAYSYQLPSGLRALCPLTYSLVARKTQQPSGIE
ncbi:MAG: class I SAM-dependent methyltransferase [Propionibacteriaceae bacterium]|nr:class I SAM-dependent methyltransferase [Propionibacteriaceae bacterium]